MLGPPESAYASSFLAGSYQGHAVLAILFDNPVHGLRGEQVKDVALSGDVQGSLFEASARSYLEFKCDKDTVQLSVFESSESTSALASSTTIQLARRMVEGGLC